MIAEQGPTTGEAAHAHGGGGAVEDFDAPPALIGGFAGKGQLDGAAGLIDLAALNREAALQRGAGLEGGGWLESWLVHDPDGGGDEWNKSGGIWHN